MKRLLVIISTLCTLLYAAEEPISVELTGTVLDQTGYPVESVTVRLAGINALSAESDANGAFTLTNAIGVIHSENITITSGFFIRNNIVVFSSISEKTKGKMSLHSGNGRLITSVSLDNLHAGQLQVALPELSSGIYLISGAVGGISFTRSLVCVGDNLYLKNKTTEARSDNGLLTLNKITATAVTDTLIASKEGYNTTRYPLDCYTMDDIDIMLTEEGRGEFTVTELKIEDGEVSQWNLQDRGLREFKNPDELFAIINGGADEYIQQGMVEGFYQSMLRTGTDYELDALVMDFSASEKAAEMYKLKADRVSSSEDAGDYDAETAILDPGPLTGCKAYAHFGQYFVEIALTGYGSSKQESFQNAALFIELFQTKIQSL